MNEFIGTWKLISFEHMEPDGSVAYPYGRNPVGLLIYDASGHMSVQVMSSDRAPLSSDDLQQVGPDEIKQILEGFTAFFGTYEVNESEAVVIHRVEGHLLPNSVGKTLKRKYELNGNRLILRPGADRKVVWERVSGS